MTERRNPLEDDHAIVEMTARKVAEEHIMQLYALVAELLLKNQILRDRCEAMNSYDLLYSSPKTGDKEIAPRNSGEAKAVPCR